jgi:3-hydroxybutyryl-CoA dehydrogenase
LRKISRGNTIYECFLQAGQAKKGEKMSVERISIIGAGTMGSEIAKWALEGGYHVALQDIERDKVERVTEQIRRTLLGEVTEQDTWHLMAEAVRMEHPEFFEGLKTPEMSRSQLEHLLDSMKATTRLEDAADGADFVVEAVYEDISLKQNIFRKLDALCPAHTILASNSSTIMISRLAEKTGRPELCIGMHFMGPMPLVEVIRGNATSETTVAVTMEIAHNMAKKPILVKKEWPAFVANSTSGGGGHEAHWLLEHGIATVEQIDEIATVGLGYIRGPFMVQDFVGLDVIYGAGMSVYQQTGDPLDKPSPVLEEKIKRGELGMKTGKGFYDWGGASTAD